MPSHIFVSLLVAGIALTTCHAAKILVYPCDPGFNSRLMNMLKMADMLNEHGHEAKFLVNNKVAKIVSPKKTELVIYEVPDVDSVPLITDLVVLDQVKNFTPFNMSNIIEFWTGLVKPFCLSVIGTDVIHQLKAEKYDAIIIDAMYDCGRVVVDYLDIPTLTYSNWGFLPDPFVFYPIISSFVCNPGSPLCSSDKMTFTERAGNFFQTALLSYYVVPKITKIYDGYKTQFGLNASRSILHSKAFRAPVLVNGDFVLDYPRPVMPHVVMITGLFHKPTSPLPEDLKTFVEGSAPHGVIVVSFGSMIDRVDEEKAEIFAQIFGEFPHRVIWRFTGPPPKALSPNTKLVSWFPQADVVSQPLTRLFITHCGISGTYEASLNAVPIIAMPLFADQEYNARKMVERGGMGVHLDFDSMTEDSLREAMAEVLANDTYRLNARRIANLLKDTETPALDRFLYWVDYVIRHQGAHHLISETALSMSNLVFYSVDVIAVFLCMFAVCISLLFSLLYFILRLSCHCYRKYNKQKQS